MEDENPDKNIENKEFYRQMITVLRPEIARELHPSHILHFMPRFLGLAGDIMRRDIMKAERLNRQDAANLFVDKLLERSEEPGWYAEFVDALREADFEKLAKRLSVQDVENDRVFTELISLAMPVLVDIKPMEVMPRLQQKFVISGRDLEDIKQLESADGSRAAMVELLFRLPKRQENWFHPFVMTLKETNHKIQLKTLEPMLVAAKSDERFKRILADLEHGNTEDFERNLETVKLQSDEDFLAEDAAHSVKSEDLEYKERRESSLEVNDTNVDVNIFTSVEEKNYSKDQKLLDVAMASAIPKKPVAAATRFSQSDFSNDLTKDNQETPVKQTDDSNRNETSRSASLSDAQEAFPKSLNVGNNFLNEWRIQGHSAAEDINLIPDSFSTGANSSNPVCRDSGESDSCIDNNCEGQGQGHSQLTSEDDTLIFTESRTSTSEAVERRLVKNEVFVSNLPEFVTTDDVVEHFGMIGDIQLNSRGKPKVRFYFDKETKKAKGEALITYSSDTYANAAVEIFNSTEFDGNILEVEIARRRIRCPEQGVPSPECTVMPYLGEQEDDKTLQADDESHEELKLRSYQDELAAKAKEGRNCVILAPTGSGKTHVAMEIIRNHFVQMKNRNRKPMIVFFVPTVALVEQQRKQFVKYLKDCRIIGLSGDQDGKLPLSELLPISDVIVLTPQILENALKEGDIETMSALSLIIFDECHHANKGHPYNMIMSHYIDENLGRNQPLKLPQVVGLTASVGVGKSKTMDQAVQCILRLCANLNAVEICTVKNNLEELMKHVNRPMEDIKEINGRREDPFFVSISDIMSKIEAKMKLSESLQENREFIQLLQAPAERGGDRYIQYMSRLQKPVDALQDQPTRRFYVACLKDLQIYNTALLINADCRTKDALDYIIKEFNPAMVNDLQEYQDDTDNWLKGLFENQKTFLEAVSRNPKYENPKLNQLKDIICREYDKAPDSRGIIFCKTREMTVALVNWMKDTKELRKFNPHNLVGTNAPSNKAGMTQVKQVDVLEYFKTGDHKLIVATSVAEEGLDVQKCNIVIRYEHVTNQIARVQSRGRARANNAQYLVVAEKGRGAAEKEESNKIREKMMQKAIDIINEYAIAEKREKIHKYQHEAQVEREMAKKGKQISQILKASQNTDEIYQLRCLKCDSFTTHSNNIRKIEASHHVILDPEYESRIKIRPHPAPKCFANFELTGKIFCKKCHADWGIMGVYKKVSFPVVKVCSLIVIKEDGERKVYRRWKEVPFKVQAITPDDLQTMVDRHKNDLVDEGDEDPETSDTDDEDNDEESMYL